MALCLSNLHFQPTFPTCIYLTRIYQLCVLLAQVIPMLNYLSVHCIGLLAKTQINQQVKQCGGIDCCGVVTPINGGGHDSIQPVQSYGFALLR